MNFTNGKDSEPYGLWYWNTDLPYQIKELYQENCNYCKSEIQAVLLILNNWYIFSYKAHNKINVK